MQERYDCLKLETNFYFKLLIINRSNSHSPMLHPIKASLYHNDPLKDEHPCKKYSKIILLFIVWFIITALLTVESEKHPFTKHVSVPVNKERAFVIYDKLKSNNVIVSLHGAFLPDDAANMTTNSLIVYLQSVEPFQSELNKSESAEIFRVSLIVQSLFIQLNILLQ